MAETQPFVLLDDARTEGASDAHLFENPRELFVARRPDEVLPVLSREMPGLDLAGYKATTLERFANPFLDHRLEDIAQNHEEKFRRRLLPVVEMARNHGLAVPALADCVARLPALSSSSR